MEAIKKEELLITKSHSLAINTNPCIGTMILNSWSKVAPSWPLKNLIATNPIAGFESLPFEEGLKQAQSYFQQNDLPEPMQCVNRECIKWLQVFFDQGQATINMPNRQLGFLKSMLSLIKYDAKIHQHDQQKRRWLRNLLHKPETIIAEALLYLGIPSNDQEQFLILMLTTLPGWAAYVKYRTHWADADDAASPDSVTESEYLAFRLTITALMWPDAKVLLSWHNKAIKSSNIDKVYHNITTNEMQYQTALLKQIDIPMRQYKTSQANAQLVFCIDVRSEPFRRAIEAENNYETFGFAGFFGVPVSIENAITGERYASCPVLLKPAHHITEHPKSCHHSSQKGFKRLQRIKKLYQSVKYNFTTPFSLVEAMGIANGIWMLLRCLFPHTASTVQSRIKKLISPDHEFTIDIRSIPFEQQVAYAKTSLETMGFTHNFSPLVIFCGHGSKTQNNAHGTALECGACGGHNGASNARILAMILNNNKVRCELEKQGIPIPTETLFLGAEHNTTTDEFDIYSDTASDNHEVMITQLKEDLKRAREINNLWRSTTIGVTKKVKHAKQSISRRSKDWAQPRPEWGLAKNASFIIGPRALTQHINLEGRAFLHSYEWEKDCNRSSLAQILTAPMIVAQWINAQYLFSTIDNVAFGGGSKITHNITGKIGVMQGNASDLMHGLPLQSVFKSDLEAYHQPNRLTVLVYAPKRYIEPIIREHKVLQNLFGHGWLHLLCLDPKDNKKYRLNRNFTWSMT